MPTDDQISQLCQQLGLSEKAPTFVRSIRSSDLSLRTRIAGGNVSGCYPSRKMASTLQAEDRRTELPLIYRIEHDDNVLDLYGHTFS